MKLLWLSLLVLMAICFLMNIHESKAIRIQVPSSQHEDDEGIYDDFDEPEDWEEEWAELEEMYEAGAITEEELLERLDELGVQLEELMTDWQDGSALDKYDDEEEEEEDEEEEDDDEEEDDEEDDDDNDDEAHNEL